MQRGQNNSRSANEAVSVLKACLIANYTSADFIAMLIQLGGGQQNVNFDQCAGQLNKMLLEGIEDTATLDTRDIAQLQAKITLKNLRKNEQDEPVKKRIATILYRDLQYARVANNMIQAGGLLKKLAEDKDKLKNKLETLPVHQIDQLVLLLSPDSRRASVVDKAAPDIKKSARASVAQDNPYQILSRLFDPKERKTAEQELRDAQQTRKKVEELSAQAVGQPAVKIPGAEDKKSTATPSKQDLQDEKLLQRIKPLADRARTLFYELNLVKIGEESKDVTSTKLTKDEEILIKNQQAVKLLLLEAETLLEEIKNSAIQQSAGVFIADITKIINDIDSYANKIPSVREQAKLDSILKANEELLPEEKSELEDKTTPAAKENETGTMISSANAKESNLKGFGEQAAAPVEPEGDKKPAQRERPTLPPVGKTSGTQITRLKFLAQLSPFADLFLPPNGKLHDVVEVIYADDLYQQLFRSPYTFLGKDNIQEKLVHLRNPKIGFINFLDTDLKKIVDAIDFVAKEHHGLFRETKLTRTAANSPMTEYPVERILEMKSEAETLLAGAKLFFDEAKKADASEIKKNFDSLSGHAKQLSDLWNKALEILEILPPASEADPKNQFQPAFRFIAEASLKVDAYLKDPIFQGLKIETVTPQPITAAGAAQATAETKKPAAELKTNPPTPADDIELIFVSKDMSEKDKITWLVNKAQKILAEIKSTKPDTVNTGELTQYEKLLINGFLDLKHRIHPYVESLNNISASQKDMENLESMLDQIIKDSSPIRRNVNRKEMVAYVKSYHEEITKYKTRNNVNDQLETNKATLTAGSTNPTPAVSSSGTTSENKAGDGGKKDDAEKGKKDEDQKEGGKQPPQQPATVAVAAESKATQFPTAELKEIITNLSTPHYEKIQKLVAYAQALQVKVQPLEIKDDSPALSDNEKNILNAAAEINFIIKPFLKNLTPAAEQAALDTIDASAKTIAASTKQIINPTKPQKSRTAVSHNLQLKKEADTFLITTKLQKLADAATKLNTNAQVTKDKERLLAADAGITKIQAEINALSAGNLTPEQKAVITPYRDSIAVSKASITKHADIIKLEKLAARVPELLKFARENTEEKKRGIASSKGLNTKEVNILKAYAAINRIFNDANAISADHKFDGREQTNIHAHIQAITTAKKEIDRLAQTILQDPNKKEIVKNFLATQQPASLSRLKKSVERIFSAMSVIQQAENKFTPELLKAQFVLKDAFDDPQILDDFNKDSKLDNSAFTEGCALATTYDLLVAEISEFCELAPYIYIPKPEDPIDHGLDADDAATTIVKLLSTNAVMANTDLLSTIYKYFNIVSGADKRPDKQKEYLGQVGAAINSVSVAIQSVIDQRLNPQIHKKEEEKQKEEMTDNKIDALLKEADKIKDENPKLYQPLPTISVEKAQKFTAATAAYVQSLKIKIENLVQQAKILENESNDAIAPWKPPKYTPDQIEQIIIRNNAKGNVMIAEMSYLHKQLRKLTKPEDLVAVNKSIEEQFNIALKSVFKAYNEHERSLANRVLGKSKDKLFKEQLIIALNELAQRNPKLAKEIAEKNKVSIKTPDSKAADIKATAPADAPSLSPNPVDAKKEKPAAQLNSEIVALHQQAVALLQDSDQKFNAVDVRILDNKEASNPIYNAIIKNDSEIDILKIKAELALEKLKLIPGSDIASAQADFKKIEEIAAAHYKLSEKIPTNMEPVKEKIFKDKARELWKNDPTVAARYDASGSEKPAPILSGAVAKPKPLKPILLTEFDAEFKKLLDEKISLLSDDKNDQTKFNEAISLLQRVEFERTKVETALHLIETAEQKNKLNVNYKPLDDTSLAEHFKTIINAHAVLNRVLLPQYSAIVGKIKNPDFLAQIKQQLEPKLNLALQGQKEVSHAYPRKIRIVGINTAANSLGVEHIQARNEVYLDELDTLKQWNANFRANQKSFQDFSVIEQLKTLAAIRAATVDILKIPEELKQLADRANRIATVKPDATTEDNIKNNAVLDVIKLQADAFVDALLEKDSESKDIRNTREYKDIATALEVSQILIASVEPTPAHRELIQATLQDELSDLNKKLGFETPPQQPAKSAVKQAISAVDKPFDRLTQIREEFKKLAQQKCALIPTDEKKLSELKRIANYAEELRKTTFDKAYQVLDNKLEYTDATTSIYYNFAEVSESLMAQGLALKVALKTPEAEKEFARIQQALSGQKRKLLPPQSKVTGLEEMAAAVERKDPEYQVKLDKVREATLIKLHFVVLANQIRYLPAAVKHEEPIANYLELLKREKQAERLFEEKLLVFGEAGRNDIRKDQKVNLRKEFRPLLDAEEKARQKVQAMPGKVGEIEAKVQAAYEERAERDLEFKALIPKVPAIYLKPEEKASQASDADEAAAPEDVHLELPADAPQPAAADLHAATPLDPLASVIKEITQLATERATRLPDEDKLEEIQRFARITGQLNDEISKLTPELETKAENKADALTPNEIVMVEYAARCSSLSIQASKLFETLSQEDKPKAQPRMTKIDHSNVELTASMTPIRAKKKNAYETQALTIYQKELKNMKAQAQIEVDEAKKQADEAKQQDDAAALLAGLAQPKPVVKPSAAEEHKAPSDDFKKAQEEIAKLITTKASLLTPDEKLVELEFLAAEAKQLAGQAETHYGNYLKPNNRITAESDIVSRSMQITEVFLPQAEELQRQLPGNKRAKDAFTAIQNTLNPTSFLGFSRSKGIKAILADIKSKESDYPNMQQRKLRDAKIDLQVSVLSHQVKKLASDVATLARVEATSPEELGKKYLLIHIKFVEAFELIKKMMRNENPTDQEVTDYLNSYGSPRDITRAKEAYAKIKSDLNDVLGILKRSPLGSYSKAEAEIQKIYNATIQKVTDAESKDTLMQSGAPLLVQANVTPDLRPLIKRQEEHAKNQARNKRIQDIPNEIQKLRESKEEISLGTQQLSEQAKTIDADNKAEAGTELSEADKNFLDRYVVISIKTQRAVQLLNELAFNKVSFTRDEKDRDRRFGIIKAKGFTEYFGDNDTEINAALTHYRNILTQDLQPIAQLASTRWSADKLTAVNAYVQGQFTTGIAPYGVGDFISWNNPPIISRSPVMAVAPTSKNKPATTPASQPASFGGDNLASIIPTPATAAELKYKKSKPATPPTPSDPIKSAWEKIKTECLIYADKVSPADKTGKLHDLSNEATDNLAEITGAKSPVESKADKLTAEQEKILKIHIENQFKLILAEALFKSLSQKEQKDTSSIDAIRTVAAGTTPLVSTIRTDRNKDDYDDKHKKLLDEQLTSITQAITELAATPPSPRDSGVQSLASLGLQADKDLKDREEEDENAEPSRIHVIVPSTDEDKEAAVDAKEAEQVEIETFKNALENIRDDLVTETNNVYKLLSDNKIKGDVKTYDAKRFEDYLARRKEAFEQKDRPLTPEERKNFRGANKELRRAAENINDRVGRLQILAHTLQDQIDKLQEIGVKSMPLKPPGLLTPALIKLKDAVIANGIDFDKLKDDDYLKEMWGNIQKRTSPKSKAGFVNLLKEIAPIYELHDRLQKEITKLQKLSDTYNELQAIELNDLAAELDSKAERKQFLDEHKNTLDIPPHLLSVAYDAIKGTKLPEGLNEYLDMRAKRFAEGKFDAAERKHFEKEWKKDFESYDGAIDGRLGKLLTLQAELKKFADPLEAEFKGKVNFKAGLNLAGYQARSRGDRFYKLKDNTLIIGIAPQMDSKEFKQLFENMAHLPADEQKKLAQRYRQVLPIFIIQEELDKKIAQLQGIHNKLQPLKDAAEESKYAADQKEEMKHSEVAIEGYGVETIPNVQGMDHHRYQTELKALYDRAGVRPQNAFGGHGQATELKKLSLDTDRSMALVCVNPNETDPATGNVSKRGTYYTVGTEVLPSGKFQKSVALVQPGDEFDKVQVLISAMEKLTNHTKMFPKLYSDVAADGMPVLDMVKAKKFWGQCKASLFDGNGIKDFLTVQESLGNCTFGTFRNRVTPVLDQIMQDVDTTYRNNIYKMAQKMSDDFSRTTQKPVKDRAENVVDYTYETMSLFGSEEFKYATKVHRTYMQQLFESQKNEKARYLWTDHSDEGNTRAPKAEDIAKERERMIESFIEKFKLKFEPLYPNRAFTSLISTTASAEYKDLTAVSKKIYRPMVEALMRKHYSNDPAMRAKVTEQLNEAAKKMVDFDRRVLGPEMKKLGDETKEVMTRRPEIKNGP
jgi:hypothetical protein